MEIKTDVVVQTLEITDGKTQVEVGADELDSLIENLKEAQIFLKANIVEPDIVLPVGKKK